MTSTCAWRWSTLMAVGGNTRDLGSFGEETGKITTLHQKSGRIVHTERGDGVAIIKRRHQDLHRDGVRDPAMASGRGRLKEDLDHPRGDGVTTSNRREFSLIGEVLPTSAYEIEHQGKLVARISHLLKIQVLISKHHHSSWIMESCFVLCLEHLGICNAFGRIRVTKIVLLGFKSVPLASRFFGFFGVSVTKLTTGRLIDSSSCGGIDMVIEDLDLEPKIDAMMREFWNGVRSKRHRIVPFGELNDVPVALVARSGVISKSTDMIFVSHGDVTVKAKKPSKRASKTKKNDTKEPPKEWTTAEEIALCKGWCDVLENYEKENGMKTKGFWDAIINYFTNETGSTKG
ncbi:hypothetical protein Tco_0500313, partial [Tanacetum coccineum]